MLMERESSLEYITIKASHGSVQVVLLLHMRSFVMNGECWWFFRISACTVYSSDPMISGTPLIRTPWGP